MADRELRRRKSATDVYKEMSLAKACGLLGLRDRDFRECDVDTIQEAFTRRVTVPQQGDPHAASKAKYLAKNHIYIHEAYQFLLKKKQAQVQQMQQQQQSTPVQSPHVAKRAPAAATRPSALKNSSSHASISSLEDAEAVANAATTKKKKKHTKKVASFRCPADDADADQMQSTFKVLSLQRADDEDDDDDERP